MRILLTSQYGTESVQRCDRHIEAAQSQPTAEDRNDCGHGLFLKGRKPCPKQYRGVGSVMRVIPLPMHAAQTQLTLERPNAIVPRAGSPVRAGGGNLRPGIGSKVLVWLERCVSGASLVAVSPAVAGVLLTVRVLSGRSPLVAHRRVGLNGELFWTLKIRTMWSRRESQSASRTGGWIEYLENAELPVIKKERDPRVISSFAVFCRRFSIDEIPQLFHVVSGKMRLVGPRPLTEIELETYYGEAAAEVLSVPPGITGLWQVMGRNRLTYAQRRRLDLFYVQKFSFKLYWFVLRKTPWCVLLGRDVF